MAVQLQHGRVRETTNLRRGPSPDDPVLTVLQRGAAVQILGREGDWLEVRAEKDQGFVLAEYVSREDAPPDEPPTERVEQKAAPRTKAARREAPRRGAEIAEVQRQLSALGFELAADGLPGPATEAALRSFQESQGLEPTGRPNAETRRALAAAVGGTEGGATERGETEGSEAAVAETEGGETEGGETEEGEPRTVSAAQHTVSDRPAHSVAEDRLGFRDSVVALVQFLRSEETAAPLAIGVCAPWGRGKTSFMRMVDEELRETPPEMPVRFARVWFNPWKYDEEKHVWAALVAALTGCIQESLGLRGRLRFEGRRFLANFRNKFDSGLGVRLAILLFLLAALIVLSVDESMQAFNASVLEGLLGQPAVDALGKTPLGALLPLLVAAFLTYQIYFKVFAVFNEGLLSHLQKSDYSDKIGTLAEFEAEMQALNDSMPRDLKVVVFIDDLDRCKPGILSQIIESMQLLEVSRKCIFVLGMDMNIVVQTIENEYADVNPEVKRSEDHAESFQHGRGYRFLEKIIQVRLGVPEYGPAQMRRFAESLSAPAETAGGPEPAVTGAASEADAAPETPPAKPEPPRAEAERVPRDSPEVAEAIAAYGAKCFRNPRRLKRFVNAFRLHVYLAEAARLDLPVDRLARFLVLTEKWPGLVDRLLDAPAALDDWLERDGVQEDADALVEPVERGLSDPLIRDLLRGPDGDDPIDGAELRRLCDWFGFAYYR